MWAKLQWRDWGIIRASLQDAVVIGFVPRTEVRGFFWVMLSASFKSFDNRAYFCSRFFRLGLSFLVFFAFLTFGGP